MHTQHQELSFEREGIVLCGTVTRPIESQPRGSVLLLSGSGPQDRDETVADKQCFTVLAEGLADAGYVVFRWDDRGVGASAGDYLAASAKVLEADVLAAMQAVEGVVGDDVGGGGMHILAGHSQGTLIASGVAARHPKKVAGLVLLGGMGLPGRDVLLAQHEDICRAEGWAEADIATTLAQKERLFSVLESATTGREATAFTDAERRAIIPQLYAAYLGEVPLETLSADDQKAVEDAIEDLLEWEWRFLLGTNPADDLQKVQCPVFAMIGESDTQVDAGVNLAMVRRAGEAGAAESVTTTALPNHNHLFQETSDSGALSDYWHLGEPFSETSRNAILSWLAALPKKQRVQKDA